MKQWLNTPVTYGCMIRIFLIYTFLLLLFLSAIDIALNIGGPQWTTLSATILTVVGILIGLGQWLVPIPTDKPELTELSPPKSVIATELSPPKAVIAHEMTFDQACELLQKQEESYLKASPHQETGTLIVSTSQDNRGVTVYLLPRGEFLTSKSRQERQDNKQIRRGTITRVRFGPHLLFVARFRELQPGRYNVWTGANIDKPKSVLVQIDKSNVSELELNWKN
jgi:hypothetical protein